MQVLFQYPLGKWPRSDIYLNFISILTDKPSCGQKLLGILMAYRLFSIIHMRGKLRKKLFKIGILSCFLASAGCNNKSSSYPPSSVTAKNECGPGAGANLKLASMDPVASLPIYPVSPNNLRPPEVNIEEKTYGETFASHTIECVPNSQAHMCAYQVFDTRDPKHRYPANFKHPDDLWYTMTQTFQEPGQIQALDRKIKTFRFKQCVALEHSLEADSQYKLSGEDVFLIKRLSNGTAFRHRTKKSLSGLVRELQDKAVKSQYYVCNGKKQSPSSGDQIARFKAARSCKSKDPKVCQALRYHIKRIAEIDNIYCPMLVRGAEKTFHDEYYRNKCHDLQSKHDDLLQWCDQLGVGSGLRGNITPADREFYICHSGHRAGVVGQFTEIAQKGLNHQQKEDFRQYRDQQLEGQRQQQSLSLTANTGCLPAKNTAATSTHTEGQKSFLASGTQPSGSGGGSGSGRPNEGYVNANGQVMTDDEEKRMHDFFAETEALDEYQPKKIMGFSVGQILFLGAGSGAIIFGLYRLSALEKVKEAIGKDQVGGVRQTAREVENATKKLKVAVEELRTVIENGTVKKIAPSHPKMVALQDALKEVADAKRKNEPTHIKKTEVDIEPFVLAGITPKDNELEKEKIKKQLKEHFGINLETSFDEKDIKFLTTEEEGAVKVKGKKGAIDWKGVGSLAAGVASIFIGGNLGLTQDMGGKTKKSRVFEAHMTDLGEKYEKITKLREHSFRKIGEIIKGQPRTDEE